MLIIFQCSVLYVIAVFSLSNEVRLGRFSYPKFNAFACLFKNVFKAKIVGKVCPKKQSVLGRFWLKLPCGLFAKTTTGFLEGTPVKWLELFNHIVIHKLDQFLKSA